MAERRLGLIMHGVTGRMGYNQHLVRSILAIREQGGVTLSNGDRLVVDPIIVGRDRDKIQRLAEKHHIPRWSTDVEAALSNPDDEVFFDAGTTQMRAGLLGRAIDAGKHVYCEKPVSDDLHSATALAKKAKSAGIKHGVVQDKLFLSGL
jgi:predicted dehydrogenase